MGYEGVKTMVRRLRGEREKVPKEIDTGVAPDRRRRRRRGA